MGEVVDGESQLVSVLALLALREGDARVVDEHVEAIVLRKDAVRQVAHGVKRGEVGQMVVQLLAARLFAYFLEDGLKAFPASAVQQHGGAHPGEL